MTDERPPTMGDVPRDEHNPEPEGTRITFYVPGGGGAQMGGTVIERVERESGLGDPVTIIRVLGDNEITYEITNGELVAEGSDDDG